MNRQVFWQKNYLRYSVLANLGSYNTLPSHQKVQQFESFFDLQILEIKGCHYLYR